MSMTAAIAALAILQTPLPPPMVVKIPGSLESITLAATPSGPGVKGMWVATTEVTWDVYDIYAYRLDQTEDQRAQGVDAASRPSKPYGAPDRGFGHQGFAAIGVTYNAATEFCKWLSAKTGKSFRLPTEAEWEHAARAGAAADPKLEETAWFWDNSDSQAQAVGKKKPNAWGLHDVLGNASEWAMGKDGVPVTCGGSWRDKAPQVGFRARAKQTPKWNENDPQNPKSKWWLSNAPFVGFRIVMDRP